MNSYLSHISAALYWDIPCLHTVIGFDTRDELETKAANSRTFYSKQDIQNYLTSETHTATLPLPKGAIKNTGEGLVSGPELIFLQLANELGLLRTILLGLQMCGHPVNRQQEALTTPSKIVKFVSKCSGHVGRPIAKLAANYLTGASASIMESLLFMILTLPNRYGGYGLSGAKFNQPIQLPAKISSQLGQNKFVVDLYWEKARLALEYDSFEHHSKMSNWIKDSRRLAVLENLGTTAISMNTIQLYNREATLEIAQILATKLGKRIRIRNSGFGAYHNELRSLFPHKN